MNARNLTLLAIVAVLLGGLALWTLGSRAPRQDVGVLGPLLPELAGRINAVEQVRLVGAGGATLATLERHGDGWTLAERGSYPVDQARLRSLLLALAEAQRVEAKTANPELHARLGVEDVGAADAYGVQVEISGGGEPLSVILGENNARGAGTYVRIAGQPQAWLIDRNIAVEKRPAEWLQRDLVNLPTSRIASVEVQPPTGAAIRIGRSGPAADLTLLDLPRGREPASEYIAESTAGLLDSLRFDDVLAADEVEPPAEGLRSTRFLSMEGIEIVLQSWVDGDRTLGRFEARLDEAAAERWAANADAQASAEAQASEDAGAADDAAKGDAAEQAGEDAARSDGPGRIATLRDEVAAMQRRFEARVFVLPAFKASNLNRDLEAYLKPAS